MFRFIFTYMSFFISLIKSPGGKPKWQYRLGLPQKAAGLKPGLSRFKIYDFCKIFVFAKASAGLRTGLSRFKNLYVVCSVVLVLFSNIFGWPSFVVRA